MPALSAAAPTASSSPRPCFSRASRHAADRPRAPARHGRPHGKSRLGSAPLGAGLPVIPLVLFLENVLFPLGALAILVNFAFSARRGVLAGLGEELRERFGGLNEEQLLRLRGRK